MQRLTLVLAAAAMSVCAFVRPSQAEPVTLHFWVAWDPQQADAIAARKEIAEYEAAHHVKIDIQNITFDALHDKLLTSIAGGDAPDLSWGLPEWFGEFYRMGALRDLTKDAKNWDGLKAIYPNVIDALTVDGHLMAMPHYLGIRALLYHADQLKAAGISNPPKTWDELVTDSLLIKKKSGKYGFGIAGTGVRAPQELIMYLAQNNVSIAKLQSDGKYRNTWGKDKQEMARATEVFSFYQRILAKEAINPDAASWGYEEEDTNFALGQYAMVIDGPWMRSRAEKHPETMGDVTISPPPYKTKPATFFEINPYYAFKAGKHPKETWDFLKFLDSKQFQQAVLSDRSPRKDVSSNNKWGKDFVSLASTGVVFPPVPLGAITRDMTDSIGRVLLKKEAPKAVAKWLSQAINRDLRRSGELSSE